MEEKNYFKFGYEYNVLISEKSSFPLFIHHEKLNKLLTEMSKLFEKQNAKMIVKFIYGNQKFISLVLNEIIYLNYSVERAVILPPDYVLKSSGIKKRDLRRAIKKSKKRIKIITDSVRFTQGGVKIDAIVKNSKERVTLRLTSDKK